MSVHYLDFRQYVVQPVLDAMGLGSQQAVSLVLKIAAWESGGCYRLDQVDDARRDGPAFGPYQFERSGFDEAHRLLDTRPALRQMPVAKYRLTDIRDLRCRLDSATFYARILLWGNPGALPAPNAWQGSLDYYLQTWRPGKPPTLAQFRGAWDAWAKGAGT